MNEVATKVNVETQLEQSKLRLTQALGKLESAIKQSLAYKQQVQQQSENMSSKVQEIELLKKQCEEHQERNAVLEEQLEQYSRKNQQLQESSQGVSDYLNQSISQIEGLIDNFADESENA